MADLFMRESPEAFAKRKPTSRFGALRLWFAILVIIGLLAMLFVGYRVLTRPKTAPAQKSQSLISFLIPTAHAQGAQPTPTISSAGASSDLRQTLMVGLFAILAVILLASVFVVFFGKDPGRVSAASDVLKTVLGFFIGAATGLLR